MQKKQIFFGWAAAIFVGLLWGVPWIAGIPLLETMSSTALVWLRYIVSVATLFTLLKVIGFEKIEKRDYVRPRLRDNKNDLVWTIICGVIGQGAFSFLSYLSLNWISASENGIIQGLIPIVILMAGSIFFKNRFMPIQILAAVGAFVGVSILTLDPSGQTQGFNFGYLICFGSVLSFASTAHARARLAKKYGSVTTMFQQDLSAALAFTLIMVLTGQNFSSVLTAFYSPLNIFCIIVLGVGVSGISYIIYIYAMKSVGVENCNMALNLMPVSAFILAVYVLGESADVYKVIAIIIVLTSLVIFVKYDKSTTPSNYKST
jgi:drug/metabolite transporter (DMT)-like permease